MFFFMKSWYWVMKGISAFGLSLNFSGRLFGYFFFMGVGGVVVVAVLRSSMLFFLF